MKTQMRKIFRDHFSDDRTSPTDAHPPADFTFHPPIVHVSQIDKKLSQKLGDEAFASSLEINIYAHQQYPGTPLLDAQF